MPTFEEKQSIRALCTVRPMGGALVHHYSAHGMAPLLALARDNPLVRAQMVRRSRDSQWIGFESGETLLKSIETGVSETALRHFDQALARIEARKQIGGRSVPAMAGGAWIIPKAIAGLPMAAMAKPRTRLPMKSFKFTLRCNGATDPRDIAKRCAMLARAAWEYTLLGGLAQVTIGYIYNYGRPAPDGAVAAVFDITLPLNNKAELAYACSALAYRGIPMMLAKSLLSPIDDDGIPSDGPVQQIAGRVRLNGSREDIPNIEKALAS